MIYNLPADREFSVFFRVGIHVDAINKKPICCDTQLVAGRKVGEKMSGRIVRRKCSEGILSGVNIPGNVWRRELFSKGTDSGEFLRENFMIPMQDYTSLRAAVMIYATLINTHRDNL